jgi:hypothetical protein
VPFSAAYASQSRTESSPGTLRSFYGHRGEAPHHPGERCLSARHHPGGGGRYQYQMGSKRRTRAVGPWEVHLFSRPRQLYTDLQWAKTGAKAQWGGRRRYVDIPAKLTGARHELCTWGEPTKPGVGGLSRKRPATPTQCVEPNRTGRPRVL